MNPIVGVAGAVRSSDPHFQTASTGPLMRAAQRPRPDGVRLAAVREPAADPYQLRPGKRSPDERSDIRGGVGVIPDVATLIRVTLL
jgi:hypothetical protein